MNQLRGAFRVAQLSFNGEEFKATCFTARPGSVFWIPAGCFALDPLFFFFGMWRSSSMILECVFSFKFV